MRRKSLSFDGWISKPDNLSLTSQWKKRLSAEGQNQEGVVGVRRMILVYKGGTEKKGVQGRRLTYPFNCFRIPERVRNMVCVICLLAKSPDYFMRLREGAHVIGYQCFPNFRTCLNPLSAVLARPTLPWLNTKTSTFLKDCIITVPSPPYPKC